MKVRLLRDEAQAPLLAMPPGPRRAMKPALRRLGDDPSGQRHGLDVKRLRVGGDPAVYRLRVGTWRAAFILRDVRIDVVRIFARDEGYGWLDRRYP